ncbi:hypothetical protein JCGZ_26202 [Jatropha curcas]|uniref:Exostosin GT47 domain-containing protein n=2 Tax=Jatropha curcas TaxID=180498 RepID=A0A067JEP9_JATCU|nr:hypothetical protein JCGZ_26202 [Jatropha curcas]
MKKFKHLFKLRNSVSYCNACLYFIISLPFLHLYLIFTSRASFSPSYGFSIYRNPCPFGMVYVYDLPSMFNQDLLTNCHDLNPWSSSCEAISNGGLGKRDEELEEFLPESLAPAWRRTDQFTLEVIFHNRVLNHQCRTLEPDSATAFYIPFYAGLAVGRYLWANSSAEERDRDCELLLNWITDQPYWKKSNGYDHFISLGRITWDFRRKSDEEWGSRFFRMNGMQGVTRLLIEKNPWDHLDISVPYPTGFHPRSAADILLWQNYVRTYNRTKLFSFVGATRGKVKNDFRALLLSQCQNDSSVPCRVVDCAETRCSHSNLEILDAFLDSDFCLQPRGDSYTRRSVFDCMVAGSIPVFFWERTAYDQYDWFLPDEAKSYSVFIHHNKVMNRRTTITGELEKYSREEINKMKEKVIEYIPKIVYAKRGLDNVKDAFDIAIDGVLRRFTGQ